MRTADILVEAVMNDQNPRSSAACDFGIDIGGKIVYESYYYPIRGGELTADELHQCVGDGVKLTELVNSKSKNPHYGIRIVTMWAKI